MKTMKTFSHRIAALLLVVTVGITALAPAVVFMAALAAREAHGGRVLPAAAASVEAALAVWAAAPVLAEPGAAAAASAASAAWAAAAATAAEPDADADSITKKAPCFEQKHGAFCFISAGYCP